MLQVVSPFWLLSLAGLAVPIAIHLWNKKKGRIVKVGSIAFMQEAQSKQLSQVRLSEIILLLLRCTLLVLLALWLADPLWKTKSLAKPKNWVLLSPELVGEVSKNALLRQTLDTLLTADAELRLFSVDFPLLDYKQLPDHNPAFSQTLSYWSLLQEASRVLPAGASISVLTGESLRSLQGKRPHLPLEVQWLTFPTADTTATWLADAYEQTNGAVRVTVGESQPAGNRFSTVIPGTETAQSTDASPAIQINLTKGLPQVQQLAKPSRVIEVDTSTIRMSIYTDQTTHTDLAYLKAALTAIQQYTQRKIKLETASTDQIIPGQYTCIFWLSSQPISQALYTQVKQGTLLLRYSEGKDQTVRTWLRLPAEASTPIAVFRKTAVNATELPIWTDGFGEAILSQKTTGKGEVLTFHSRFHPAWNDLVWSDVFPQTLFELLQTHLLIRQTQQLPAVDLRQVDARQLLPKQQVVSKTRAITYQNYSLRELLWLLALLLLGIERWLSECRTTNTVVKMKSVA